ncbi:MAG TPA: SCP2 sterol-binding domain-containing protein [Candidatus Deferrimicrobiaceae bacterium]|jgi:putative sterol carrier protein
MAETTVKGFFDALEGKLAKDPSRLAGMTSVFQFRVGEAGYHVDVADGRPTVSEGVAASPDCVVTVSEADFLDLLSGKLNGQLAFMMGKLKVAGDMGLALKFASFLK